MKLTNIFLLFVSLISFSCRKDTTQPPETEQVDSVPDPPAIEPIPCPEWDSLVFGTKYSNYDYWVSDIEVTSNGHIFVLFNREQHNMDGEQKIYRSTDNGATWEYSTGWSGIYGSAPRSIHAYSGDTLFYLTASDNKVGISYDNGDTWIMYPSLGNDLMGPDNIFFTSKDTGFVSTTSGVAFTTDGCSSWTIAPGIGENVNALYFPSQTIGYAVTSGGCFKTTDSGNSWGSVFDDASENLTHLSFINEDKGVIGGKKLYLTEDGGMTWSAIHNSPVRGSSFKNADTLYTIQSDGVLLSTSNNGLSWETECDADFKYTLIKFYNGVGYLGTGNYHDIGIYNEEESAMIIFRK